VNLLEQVGTQQKRTSSKVVDLPVLGFGIYLLISLLSWAYCKLNCISGILFSLLMLLCKKYCVVRYLNWF